MWDSMPENEGEGVTLAQRKAIGRLMLDVGIASQMEWSGNKKGQFAGSSGGAYVVSAAKGLRDSFGYASACAFEHTESLAEVFANTGSSYKNAILASLDAQMPVVLDVSNATSAHSIVLDGYGFDGSEDIIYCHINCGWSPNETVNIWYYVGANELLLGKFSYCNIAEIAYNIHPSETGDVISGRVYNSMGKHVKGATVTLVDSSGARRTTTTNARGIYAFRVTKDGSYTLSAKRNDRESEEQSVSLTMSENSSYALTHGKVPIDEHIGQLGNKWGVKLYLPRAEEDDTPPEPDDEDPGTETGTGTIKSEADWIALASSKYAQSATFSIGADLYLSDTSCVVFDFCGTVKGNGHTITIDKKLEAWHLFGTPSGATFERVSFSGIGLGTAVGCAFVKCRPKDIPLVREARNCTFIDCMGTVSIATSTFQMGALSRFAKDCTFKNCKVWGSISGDDNTGGLVGDAEGCSFTDCISLAKVSGGSEVGGLVGWAEANCQFLNCAARGEVSGRGFVGGLVGYCEGSTLKNCQATGNVTGGKVTGGFAGQLRNCEAQKCSAKGKVTCVVELTDAPGGIGGFAGEIVGLGDGTVSLEYCAATGAVMGDGGSSVGGFVGDCHGETATTKIQCSYASGTVVGGSFVGGFAGELSNCSIFNCYSTGSATANGFSNSSGSGNGMDTGISAYAGGFAGQADSKGGTDCRYCYAVGYVKTAQGSSMLDMSYSGGLTPLPLSDEQADMMSSMLSMFMSDCVSCYWSIPGTGRKYSGMGIGKSAVDMKKQSTFTGWDFSSIWAIDEGASYPYFKELGRTGVIDDIGDDSDDTGGDDPSGGDVGFTVTVTFDANGGTVSPTTKTLEKDDEIGELPTPSRKGSTFAGWWTEVNGGWQVTDDTIIFKDMTLHAHWRSSSAFPDLLPYTPSGWSAPIVVVRSSSDTVDATGITSTDTLFVRRAYICRNAPVSTRFYIKIYVDGVEKYSRYSESMAEDQWKAGDAYELGMLAPGTHTIKMIVDSSDAVPESDEGNNTYVKTITVGGGSVCTVTFNANGGTVSPTTKTVESGKAVGDLPTPTYGSYVFDGWYTQASGGTRVTESTEVTANVTYYAHWIANSKPNLVVNSVTACRKTVYIGETFHLRYTVGNAGKASGGSSVTSISDGNNKYSFRQACGSLPVGSERTYRLNINSSTLGVGSHTITVAADISGQIAESSESDNSKVIYLSVINLPETGNNVDWQFHARSGSPDVAYLSKSAYSTKAETTFKQGETIYVQINFWNAQQKNTTGEVKAAALLDTGDGWQWSWTSLSGGTTAYISDSSRVVSVLQNLLPGTYTLEFLLDNARFHGGDYVWYEPSKLNNTKTIEFTVVGNAFAVTFDATGGAVSPAMRTVVAGAPVGTLPTPTRSSHTFAGWFTAASGGTQVTASTVVTGDVTYYAHWYDDRAGRIVVRSATPATAGRAARIVLGRVGGSVGRIAVKVKTQSSTGICGTDFAYVKEVLVWEDGDTSDKVIEIPTYASGAGKSLRVKLATLTTGAYAGCVTARIAETKVYAEMQPPNPGRVVVTGPEPLAVTAGETLHMKFSRVGGSDGSIAVKAKTQTSTALMGVNGSADFDYVKATLEWGDGDTSERHIDIPTYAGPWEGVRMLRVKLATLATGAYAGNLVPALDQSKIYADIESPVAFGTVYVAPEGKQPVAGQTLRLVFRRVGGRDYPIAVKYKVQTSTAIAGVDFEYKKGVVVWDDGEDGEQVVEVPTYPSAGGKQLRVKLSTLTQGDYTGCVTPHLNSAKVYVPLY